MSKSNLESILKNLLSKSTDSFRRTEGDRLTTSLYISPALVEQEIIAEVKFTAATARGKVPVKVEKALHDLSVECYNNVLKAANASSLVDVQPFEDGVIITASGDRNNFKVIYNVTNDATRLLRNRVNVLLQQSRLATLPANIFDIGHTGGSNTEIQIGSSLAGNLNDPGLQKFLATTRLSEIQVALDIASQFAANGDKSYVVKAILEAKGPNRAKAEAAFRKAFLLELDNFVRTNDWANQESSDSVMKNIENQLINTAMKRGAKGQKPKSDTSSSSASVKETISSSAGVKQAFDPALSDLKVDEARSYVSLIPLLNAKLPEAVKANMTGGALHNRTGRFASSVRIMSVSQTPQGYPRLNYTYMRSPYDVFDPALGKSPWNTPGRDPKTLIEKSIRDIAKDYAIGRFYVARA